MRSTHQSNQPSPRNVNGLNLQGGWRAWTDLDAEIASEGDVVGSLGEEVPSGGVGGAGALGALEHDEALPLVEVGGERGEVELGEEGPLQGGVDAVHGAELPLLHLVVQQPAVARRRVHRPAPEPPRDREPSSGAAMVASPPLRIARDSSRGIEETRGEEKRN